MSRRVFIKDIEREFESAPRGTDAADALSQIEAIKKIDWSQGTPCWQSARKDQSHQADVMTLVDKLIW